MECKGYILNIGKAAKLSNLTVKTVRYYADIGLVKPLKNSSSGYRDFSDPPLTFAKVTTLATLASFLIIKSI